MMNLYSYPIREIHPKSRNSSPYSLSMFVSFFSWCFAFTNLLIGQFILNSFLADTQLSDQVEDRIVSLFSMHNKFCSSAPSTEKVSVRGSHSNFARACTEAANANLILIKGPLKA